MGATVVASLKHRLAVALVPMWEPAAGHDSFWFPECSTGANRSPVPPRESVARMSAMRKVSTVTCPIVTCGYLPFRNPKRTNGLLTGGIEFVTVNPSFTQVSVSLASGSGR